MRLQVSLIASIMWRKKNPPPNGEGFNYVCNVFIAEVPELLCLTEDTVDLGAADWADALCHTTT
jgi:hypothetical protein